MCVRVRRGDVIGRSFISFVDYVVWTVSSVLTNSAVALSQQRCLLVY